jgi:hypothetical protein
MLVTLVAILCNSQLCLEKVVTNSEQSGITMTACQVNAQIGIAAWLANGPYHDWRLKSYKCVAGTYVPNVKACRARRSLAAWRSNGRSSTIPETGSGTRSSQAYPRGSRFV